MPTLFGFGDSYTEGHNLDKTYPVYKRWREYRPDKTLPETWFDLLCKKISYFPKNYAVAGMSNDEIIDTINSKSREFKKGDIVIINWTYTHRFRWATYERDINGNLLLDGVPKKPRFFWKRLGVSLNDHDLHYIDPKIQLSIAENKTHKLYLDQIYNYENILDYLSESVGFKLYYWSVDPTLIYNLDWEYKNKSKYILSDEVPSGKDFMWVIQKNGGKTIGQECNGEVNDMHLGESGHKIQSELFYEYFSKYQDFKKII